MRRFLHSSTASISASSPTPDALILTTSINRLAVESNSLKIPSIRSAIDYVLSVASDIAKTDGTGDSFVAIIEELDILTDRVIKPLQGAKPTEMPLNLRPRLKSFASQAESMEKEWRRSHSYQALYPIFGQAQPVLKADVNIVREKLRDLVDGVLMKDPDGVKNLLAAGSSEIAQHTSAAITAKGALKTALSLMKESLDGVPVPGLKGAAGGLLEVIKALEQTSSNADDMKVLTEHVNRLQSSILRTLKDKAEVDIPPMLNARLKVIEGALEQVGRAGRDMVARHAVRRFLDRAEDTAFILSLRETLRNSISEFMLEGEITMELLLGEMVHRGLLNELPVAPDAKYDCGLREAKHQLGCLENTRVDVLNTICHWVDRTDPDASRIYWLKGLAGTGKSAVAQSVAKWAEENDKLAATFFFSRDEEKLKDPLLLFTTIAYQLAYYKPCFKLRIVEAIKAARSAEKERRAILSQLDELIVTPLGRVEDCPPSPILIILDALDECDIQHTALKDLIIALDTQIATLPFALKVLVTSRPDDHINSAFASLPSQSYSLQDIEDSIVQEDISLFLTVGLNNIAKQPYTNLSGWPSPEEVTDLTKKSGTLFIYASTALSYIGSPIYNNPKRQLATLLHSEPSSGGSAHRGIDNLYLRVLRDAIPAGEDDYLLKRFQAIAGAIVTVFNPQSTVFLEHLLDRDDVRGGLAKLQSVFIVPTDESQPVRFFHPSFYDFLTSRERCSEVRFLIDENEHHAHMALACFAVMEKELKRDICGIEQFCLINGQIADIEQRIDRSMSPPLRYACIHWPGHLFRGVHSGDLGLLESFIGFCRRKLLQWLEAVGLLGGFPEIRYAMYDFLTLSDQLKERETPSPPEVFAALNFIVAIISKREILEQVAHIYTFLAEGLDDILKELYKEEMGTSARIQTMWVSDLLPGMMKQLSVFSASLCLSPLGDRCAMSFGYFTSGMWLAGEPMALLLLEADGSISPLSCSAGLAGPFVPSAACFSPDGRYLASGSQGGEVAIWDADSRELLNILVGHAGMVNYIAYSPDGSLVASASKDRTVCIWDSITGEFHQTIVDFPDPVASMALSHQTPSVLVIQSESGSIRLWCSATGVSRSEEFGGGPLYELVKIGEFLGREPADVAISVDGAYVLAGESNTINLWITNPVPQVVCSWRPEGELKSLEFSGRAGGCWAIVQFYDGPSIVHQLSEPLGGKGDPVVEDGAHVAGDRIWICRLTSDSEPTRLLHHPLRSMLQASVGERIVLVDSEWRMTWLDFSEVDGRETTSDLPRESLLLHSNPRIPYVEIELRDVPGVFSRPVMFTPGVLPEISERLWRGGWARRKAGNGETGRSRKE